MNSPQNGPAASLANGPRQESRAPEQIRVRLLRAPVEIRTPDGLVQAAWNVADELGWARLLKCRLVTIDERLLRGVARLKIAVRPREL